MQVLCFPRWLMRTRALKGTQCVPGKIPLKGTFKRQNIYRFIPQIMVENILHTASELNRGKATASSITQSFTDEEFKNKRINRQGQRQEQRWAAARLPWNKPTLGLKEDDAARKKKQQRGWGKINKTKKKKTMRRKGGGAIRPQHLERAAATSACKVGRDSHRCALLRWQTAPSCQKDSLRQRRGAKARLRHMKAAWR